jgi:V-type H+-transporting ATPase subunit a
VGLAQMLAKRLEGAGMLAESLTAYLVADVFSKSLNIFGSAWQVSETTSSILHHKQIMLQSTSHGAPGNMSDYCGSPYLSKIVFLNSFKMKASVILGVIHVMFGLVLSVGNSKYFQRPFNIIGEVIPQVSFYSFEITLCIHNC